MRRDTLALYLAGRNPRTARRAKIVIALIVGYALGPIQLFPDFIPILGSLDDVVIVPLGIRLQPGSCLERSWKSAGQEPG